MVECVVSVLILSALVMELLRTQWVRLNVGGVGRQWLALMECEVIGDEKGMGAVVRVVRGKWSSSFGLVDFESVDSVRSESGQKVLACR